MTAPAANGKQQMMVAWADLEPTYTRETNPNKMSEAEFNALVALMRTEGALQTILVTPIPKKKGKFRIVDGHHRYWAAEVLGGMALPAICISASEAKLVLVGVGLNRIRGDQDLTVAGNLIRDVMDKTGWVAENVATLTGMSVDEIDALTQRSNNDADELFEELASEGLEAGNDEEIDINTKPYVLEISFTSKEKFQLARKRLRKAAGKSKDLALGLLSLLGEDDAEEA